MAHTTSEDELMTIDTVEDQTLQYTRGTIVVIKIIVERRLGERLAEEHASVLTDHLQVDTVVNELLSSLILDHTQAVVSRTTDVHLIRTIQPLDVLHLIVILHPDGSLWLGSLRLADDNILRLFLLLATRQHRGSKGYCQHHGHSAASRQFLLKMILHHT